MTTLSPDLFGYAPGEPDCGGCAAQAAYRAAYWNTADMRPISIAQQMLALVGPMTQGNRGQDVKAALLDAIQDLYDNGKHTRSVGCIRNNFLAFILNQASIDTIGDAAALILTTKELVETVIDRKPVTQKLIEVVVKDIFTDEVELATEMRDIVLSANASGYLLNHCNAYDQPLVSISGGNGVSTDGWRWVRRAPARYPADIENHFAFDDNDHRKYKTYFPDQQLQIWDCARTGTENPPQLWIDSEWNEIWAVGTPAKDTGQYCLKSHGGGNLFIYKVVIPPHAGSCGTSDCAFTVNRDDGDSALLSRVVRYWLPTLN